jgi:hypothetical protein
LDAGAPDGAEEDGAEEGCVEEGEPVPAGVDVDVDVDGDVEGAAPGAPAENGPEIDDAAPRSLPPCPDPCAPAAPAHADSRIARTSRAAFVIIRT